MQWSIGAEEVYGGCSIGLTGFPCSYALHAGDPSPPIYFYRSGWRVKPADTHSSSVQVLQGIENDVEILGISSAQHRSSTPCSTSGSYTCRKSLRNRPPIDYSRFDHVSDEDSDVE